MTGIARLRRAELRPGPSKDVVPVHTLPMSAEQRNSTTQRVPEYHGPLTPSQVCDGILAARKNAQYLYQAGESLYGGAFYAPAAALAILSSEEAYKEVLLLRLLHAESSDERKALWREFRDHRIKQTTLHLAAIYRRAVKKEPGAVSFEELRSALWREFCEADCTERRKQRALYTNCVQGPTWTLPEQQIGRDEARDLLDNAKECVAAGRTYSPEELELYKKYLSGIRRQPRRGQRLAVVALQSELVRRGLPPHPYLPRQC